MSPTRVLRLAGFALVGVMMLIPVAIAVHAGLYNNFVDNALSAWGLWGNFAIYLATRPGRKECAATVALGVLMRLAYDLTIGEHGYPGYYVIGMGTFLGLACLVVLAAESFGAATERRAECRRSVGVIALLSYIGVCLGFYISFARLVLPNKLDYFLFNFDGSLGMQASFLAGKFLQSVRPLLWTEIMVYNSLGFWFSLIYAVHAWSRAEFRFSILKLFIANAFIGFSLYFLFPAMGPKFAFASYPVVPGAVHPASAVLSGIPNAMPSLHFAGTLLIWWLAKPWKWLYRVTGVFSALTALATLGLGEHYLVDLIVAVPYALAIFALSTKTPEKRIPLACGGLLVAFWLCFLRAGIYVPALSWLLVAVTLITAFVLQNRLSRRVFAKT